MSFWKMPALCSFQPFMPQRLNVAKETFFSVKFNCVGVNKGYLTFSGLPYMSLSSTKPFLTHNSRAKRLPKLLSVFLKNSLVSKIVYAALHKVLTSWEFDQYLIILLPSWGHFGRYSIMFLQFQGHLKGPVVMFSPPKEHSRRPMPTNPKGHF